MKPFIREILNSLSEKQIKRIKNTNKEYIYFHISVFNVGTVIHIKCSDIYKDINPNTWNGYDFMLDSTDANNCLEILNK